MRALSKLLAATSLLSVSFLLIGAGANSGADSELLKPWVGPYGGFPRWDLVKTDEFIPAFDAAIAQANQEIAAIASNAESPTFENTIVAMERAGSLLSRVQNIFDVYSSNLNVGPIPEIENAVNPKLTAYYDGITQNAALFARISKVYESACNLTPPQKRLLENTYKSFVRQGATLGETEKARMTEINTELANLSTQFSQNVLKDEEELVTWIENESDLDGLSPSLVSGYAKAAADLGQPGKWAVRNTRSAMEPFLTYAKNRGLRETVWKTYYSRGDNGDKNDNNEIVSKILKLRTERAKLLGYESHAHITLEPRMAKTPDNAMKLMMEVWPKAVKRVHEEVADMQELADQEGAGITIEGWDYRYYAEKVRKAKYDLDSNEVREYLQLEKMVEAIHWMAGEVFGLTLTRVSDVPGFHPDVRVYKVTNSDGKLVGLWYLDPYARDGKRSGAWMTAYRVQQNLDGKWVTPLVSNNSNFVKTDDGKPVLITWDDATTLFHEFGHALHGLSSNVTYPSQAGTSVARDYVEFPSQLMEHWFPTKEVLARFARHYETGAPMSDELLAKIEKASKFNQGFATVEYLSAALVDMKLHLSTDTIDPDKFERETLAELGMPKEIVMRHRIPQFLHLFTYGYEAGYYSYLWSDALTADAAEYFEEQQGGYYDKAAAQNLIKNVFSVGDTIDPAEGFRKFRGRDVDTKALLRKRGFPVE
ncbi:MAG: M3 family metallopeptidase [Bdellovibrionales bacterium]|nr:M3 family metallopeptidase [Bdellovibrionales bacterium]